MNIEQKMAYLRKALEMGADIEVDFHNFRTQEAAENAISTLNEVVPQEFVKRASKEKTDSLRWFKATDYEESKPFRFQRFYTVFYFEEKDEYLQEDVVLDGGEEVGA
jgi:hypothetical protein